MAAPEPSTAPPARGRVRGTPTIAGVLGLGAAVIGLRIGLMPLSDNSFLTHLATGRLILDGGIPRHDVYSFTAEGEPWVVQSWLVSLLYGVVEEVGGADGLLLLQGLLCAVLAALVFRLTRRAGTLVPRVGLAALALGVGAGTWSERPLLIGLILLALLLVLVDSGADPRWAVPILWAWVNVHGSFPLGLVAVAALAAGAWLDGQDDPRRSREVRVLAWAAAGAVLGAVNPLGPTLLLFPLELLDRSDILREVIEWQPPRWERTHERVFLVQLLVGVALLVRRPGWRRSVPVALFAGAALVATRNVAVAGIVLVPVTAPALAGLGSLRSEQRSPVLRPAALALVALAGVLTVAALDRGAFDLSSYPRRELAVAGAGNDRVIAPDIVGNYLEATLGEKAQVFFDDRYDMYPPAIAEDYLTLFHARPAWAEVLDRHGADAVVWQADDALATALRSSGDWHIVAASSGWLVARPR